MIPYNTRDESPRTRFKPGPEGDEVWVSLISITYDKDNNHKPNNFKPNSNN
jgi:hypothetical protein